MSVRASSCASFEGRVPETDYCVDRVAQNVNNKVSFMFANGRQLSYSMIVCSDIIFDVCCQFVMMMFKIQILDPKCELVIKVLTIWQSRWPNG